jgi:microcystin-dependent protein
MSDPFIAEVRMWALGFAPRNWAFCNGQLLPIAQNTALFSLVGTYYGGNGQTTFGLPNLQGRLPMHQGHGPGLATRQLGEIGGSETATLQASQMPAHGHTMMGGTTAGAQSPSGNVPGVSPAKAYHPGPTDASSPALLQNSGGGAAHNNMPPYLVVNFCIALTGIFPSRP